jgi:adenylate cyclase
MRSRIGAWLSQAKIGRRQKLYIVPAAVAAACALLAAFAVGNFTFLTNANQFVADGEIAAFAPAEPQDPDIVIVAITEDTLAQFPYRAPVDREFLANLLADLAQKGPRAIGIDLLFDQPTEPAKDAALKRVLTALDVPVVVAYTDAKDIVDAQQKAFLNSFIPKKMRGLANLEEDQFDVVRWVYPGANTQDGYVMGLARALAEAVGVKTPSTDVPIAWHGRPDKTEPAFREFPAHAVKLLPAEWFKNKIVLIGTDITLVDRHRTPYTTVFSGGEGMLPGVVIQAHALSQLLNGRSAPSVSWQTELAIAVLLGAVGAVLGGVPLPLAARIGAGLLVALLFAGGGVELFHSGGSLVGLVTPSLSLAMSFFTMEAISGSEARAQREFVTNLFSHQVAPQLVTEIISNPERMASLLEGERRVMTFLFTDVADFTMMSEGVESKVLARVLNEYLGAMTDIVHKHGGIVDKFIGDSVFAIFNAPIDLPDHAQAAVRCALEMDRFSSAFSKQQTEQGVPFGRTRIGIHTGPAVAGLFGSRERHNYTASGDAVNTASRLEGLNKHFGTRIGVSGEARALCPDISFRPTAVVVLKGKHNAIEVWEPLQEHDARGEYIERYRAAYAALEDGLGDARALFEALACEASDDPTIAFHLARIRHGATGVTIVMTEK